MSGGDNQRGRLLGAAAAREAVELGKTVEGAGLGQLLGEVMLEHERLDREGGRPLFLAVAKDGSAFSATPVSSSSCVPLGVAVGRAPWESGHRIHRLGQGSLPSSSEARKWHLTGLGALTNLGGPGFWAKEVQAWPQGHGRQAMATSGALVKWACPVLLGFLDG